MRWEKDRACCFTGHRTVPKAVMPLVLQKLSGEIKRLHEERGVDVFLAGGALGFDTLAAEAVLRYRQSEGAWSVRLVLVLPCLDQADRWSRKESMAYHELIRAADEVVYTGDVYVPGCMHVRNRFLVDHSSVCLCYFEGRRRSGTAYTVGYAEKQGLQIVNLAEPQEEGGKPDGTAADKMPRGRGPL